jgi:hypothetical protein
MKRAFKEGLDALNSKRTPSNKPLSKYVILSLIYYISLRTGDLNNLRLLDVLDVTTVKGTDNTIKLFKDKKELDANENYAIIS